MSCFVNTSVVEYANEKLQLELRQINKKLLDASELEAGKKSAEDLLQFCSSIGSPELRKYAMTQLESDINQFVKKLADIEVLKVRKGEIDDILVQIPNKDKMPPVVSEKQKRFKKTKKAVTNSV